MYMNKEMIKIINNLTFGVSDATLLLIEDNENIVTVIKNIISEYIIYSLSVGNITSIYIKKDTPSENIYKILSYLLDNNCNYNDLVSYFNAFKPYISLNHIIKEYSDRSDVIKKIIVEIELD